MSDTPDPKQPAVPTLEYAERVPTWWDKARAFVRRLGPAGPLAVLTATFPLLGGFVLIGFVSRLAPWLQAHALLGLLIVVCGFSLTSGLSLLPTYACAILAGYAFKFWAGFPASMLAFCGGALIAYGVSARAAGDRVIEIVREHPKWEAVRVALLDAGFARALWIVTLIRLPPTSPFAAANFVMGTIRAPLAAYLLGTLIGMAPRTAVVVWAASNASTLDFSQGKNVWSYAFAVATTVVVVAIIGHLANQAIRRVTAAAAAPPAASSPAAAGASTIEA